MCYHVQGLKISFLNLGQYNFYLPRHKKKEDVAAICCPICGNYEHNYEYDLDHKYRDGIYVENKFRGKYKIYVQSKNNKKRLLNAQSRIFFRLYAMQLYRNEHPFLNHSKPHIHLRLLLKAEFSLVLQHPEANQNQGQNAPI